MGSLSMDFVRRIHLTASSQFDGRRYKLVVSVTGLIAITVILLQFYIQFSGYHRHLAEAAKLTDAIARVVEDQTQRTLQSISLVLDTARIELPGRRTLNHKTLREQLRSIPEIRGLFLVGLDGTVLDSTLAEADIGKYVGDEDFILRLYRSGTDTIVIGKPIPRRTLSGPEMPVQAFLPFAMRLPDDAGYLVAAINISFFQLQYQSLLQTSHVGVSLASFDGTVLMDAQEAWSLGLEVGKLDPIFNEYLPGIERATFSRPALAGKKEQLVSFRVTRTFPMVVSAAIDLDVIRGDWFSSMFSVLLPTFVAVCLVLVALIHMREQLGHIALQEAELRASRDAAEAASKAKSQFLAVMSHEVRTPMNAVLGLSSVLLEEPLTGSQRANVQSIHDAGEGLLVVLNDILEYSRLEAGEIALEEAPFAPGKHLQSALDIITPLAQAKCLDMHGATAVDIPKAVKGDAGRLRQVLINVASNAVKFTSHGYVEVRLECARQDEGRVRLERTGIGIEPDRIQSIFREFIQADTTIQRRFGGSGLGLAICKRIIDRMGGEIAITSRPGVGTTVRFSVTLPLADEDALETNSDDGSLEGLHEAIAHLGTSLRLLVVDDNKTNHVVTARLLRHFDIDIDHAHDGNEGLTAARRKPYHVILMDTQMPGIDGLAATRALRSSKGPNRRTRVIAFTANAMREDVAAAMAAGSDDVVTKPVRKHELVAALQRALEEGDRPGSDVTSAPDVSEDAPAFNAAVYREFVEQVGDDAIDEIVAVFVEETDVRLARLDEMHGHASKIGQEAHTLKSSAATLGLTLMSREATALESEAAAGAVEDLDERVARLRRAYRDGMAGIASSTPAAAA